MPQRIQAGPACPLYTVAATRRLEQAAAAALPPHTLMQRAGLAAARLAMALAPHARTIWVACGPGNNGGDGLEAAMHLQQRGFAPVVTWLGDEVRLPDDARASLARARSAGVSFAAEAPARYDLAIDALLGIGSIRPPEGAMRDWLQRMATGSAPVLSVDLPSDLDADRGGFPFDATARRAGTAARHCLSLLTLKPGLFTAHGRDLAGEVWFDDLGCTAPADAAPDAWLAGAPAAQLRPHASHKGSWGDVAVLGGAAGMDGAAVLAASAALHAGAGRVFVGLLGHGGAFGALHPELMFRDPASLPGERQSVVCGCGGGDAVRAHLPRVIAQAQALVLDADALNAIAADAALQTLLARRGTRSAPTVLTPHPLEAARLLGLDAAAVQSDRLRHAQQLAERFACTVVLKGSGSVIAAPGAVPRINPTGNARLATAGTGDVLAGMIGAALATGLDAQDAASGAVFRHGALAERWDLERPLTAGELARGAVR